MTDNFDKLTNILKFEPGTFYLLQIIQRKKDNPYLESNSKVIKEFYINDQQYLDSKKNEIKLLCADMKARAYLHINKKSYKDISFTMMEKLIDIIRLGNYERCKTVFNASFGNKIAETRETKRWIIDVDEKDFAIFPIYHQAICLLPIVIKKFQSKDYASFCERIETPNGCHIITSPFDVKKFSEMLALSDIKYSLHKNNPTILYAP